MLRRLATVLATGCYTGYIPVAPGTAGSILAAALCWQAAPDDPLLYGGVVACLTPVGIWAAGQTERQFGHDGRQIVIDEIIGVFVTLIWLPRTPLTLGAGLILFRILDILKPFPVHRAQRLPGGLGVVADDVIAGVYANLLVRGVLAVMA